MRRLLFALPAALACGSPPQPAPVVSVAPVATHAPTPQHVAAIPAQRRPFELVLGFRTCALIHGTLHCREKVTPAEPLAAEPALLGLEHVTSAAFGRDFGCVTTSAGGVECFGGNHFGQLGAGVRADRHEAPLSLPGIHGAKRVYAGPAHACAILDDGRVSCWGKNQAGENGSSTNYLEAARELVEPQVVRGVTDATELALAWDTTCAASAKGHVSCWGRARLPEQQARGNSNETPTPIPSLEGASSLTANEESFCAVKDEKLLCWGDMMMLSPNGTRDELNVLPVAHATRVSLGSTHGCALDASGAVYCFGSNGEGQLGKPPIKDSYEPLAPTKVSGIPRAVDVACGSSVSCAVTATDEVWCWGRFDWSKDDVHAPVRVAVR
jgi:alpha-tubulin suppressor-like RCC1 family protein